MPGKRIEYIFWYLFKKIITESRIQETTYDIVGSSMKFIQTSKEEMEMGLETYCRISAVFNGCVGW